MAAIYGATCPAVLVGRAATSCASCTSKTCSRFGRLTDALAAHEARNRGDSRINHDLQGKFDDLDEQYRNVQSGPTLAERRKLGRAFFSLVADVEAAMYADAKRSGEDPRMAQLRIAEHTRLNVLTSREALGWNSEEVWAEFLKADNRGRDNV